MKTKTVQYSMLVIAGLLLVLSAGMALASHTPDPSQVTIAGNLQSELGCAGDWDPGCAATNLAYDAADEVWQNTFNVPAGNWEYKAALNGSWDENYGQNAAPGGANIGLSLASPEAVKFYYDHKTHWITSSKNAVIASVPGSFQSELGCPGDWQPECLRSWLQDPDGDGTYSFSTTAISPGSYEAKVAINESWTENYGAGGVQNGPNIPFSVAVAGSTTTFTYNTTSHVLEIQVIPPAGHYPDNNVEYFGLGHNSQDSLYRLPYGAIVPGTELTLRFRTYHNDVTAVKVRVWDGVANSQFFLDMQVAASEVSCYDAAQPDERCDFWQASYTPPTPTTLYYRFIVQDGSATAYYDDDVFQDGGWGEAKPQLEDDSYVVTVYDPAFQTLAWMKDAVVYQIFPDRFNNGRSSNDPTPSEARYGYPPSADDQIIKKGWYELPEGYCRNYTNPAEACSEGPRGRDYFGGDLRGVQQRLNYLKDLGVTVIYFNPIFDAASNHAYDTQDYYKIDKFFGTNKEFEDLVKQAEKFGIRVVLDGVFNHVSSDSPYFDRSRRFTTVGACESVNSPYRSWFIFYPMIGGPCAGPGGPNTMTYASWFGFDSLPVLDKTNPQVQALFYGTNQSVGEFWLNKGASGWRLDVMGDTSFPADFWPEFRAAIKAADADAVIIGELWKKHETLVKVRGDQADTAMNYRFRNAILGFFGTIDNKGFVDDGQSNQSPSLFAKKLASIREDYPDATYYTMLNLMDSHDTKRILWSLTPGENNREDKEFNPVNLAKGKSLLRLATVVQMTIPGAPTIYYGDEVGVTGDDDPDDRRTFPWNGEGPYGSGGDSDLLAHYRLLTNLRKNNPVLRDGELTFLLTDDANRTLAYLMRTPGAAAIVAINRNETNAQTLVVDAHGLLPDGVQLYDAMGAAGSLTAVDGALTIQLPALSAAILLPTPGQDLVAPSTPANLRVIGEGDGMVSLSWDAVPDAASYIVYRSPLSGGGYEAVAEVSSLAFTDENLINGQAYYYVVSAVDAAGNEGQPSNEARGLPHLVIGWANLQWPPSMVHTISILNRTDTAYGQVWIGGHTNQPGQTPSLQAQLGFGPAGSNPQNGGWTWVEASFNVDAGNNDEFKASLLPEEVGSFDYVYRYTTTNGRDWLYADLNGPIPAGATPPNPGKLTVNSSGDTTAPAVPTGLRVVSATTASIDLEWEAVAGDPSLYGYEVFRKPASNNAYTLLALVTANQYSDKAVEEGAAYSYKVRSVDLSFNRSEFSSPVSATAELRTVSVTFNVTVPAHTPPEATVFIAGTLDRLEGGLPAWDPSGVVLTKDATHWTITLTGLEGTQLEYKYTLGSWDNVEKGGACDEIANRTLQLTYGTTGNQTVNDAVLNWRNISPCGD